MYIIYRPMNVLSIEREQPQVAVDELEQSFHNVIEEYLVVDRVLE